MTKKNTGIYVSKRERSAMMALRAAQLRAEVNAAWLKACEVEAIPADAKFVVFSNTVEAAVYNELAGMLLRRLRELNEAGYETAVL